MNETKTRERLLEHANTYPELKPEDIFKYVYQSSFGCEHLVSKEEAVLENILAEYESFKRIKAPLKEALDGNYSRVYLSCLDEGLFPSTLARLFCLSAKKEENGKDMFVEKLEVARELANEDSFPFDKNEFLKSLDAWRKVNCTPIHHSEEFKKEYRPAYRVIANKYADFLPVFIAIDKLSGKGTLTVAIEGGSASGKSTLADILKEVYDCNVFHTDDFFLRPEQRTKERFEEIGGNLDRERFYDEIVIGIKAGKEVRYRRFDCSKQSLGDEIRTALTKLTVVEGVYSMHTSFGKYYDLAVFLDISPEYQKKRILKRNPAALAERFFGEWIPLENRYFLQMNVKERCDAVLKIEA